MKFKTMLEIKWVSYLAEQSISTSKECQLLQIPKAWCSTQTIFQTKQCKFAEDSIVEDRPVNEAENKIYQELSTGQGLDKDDLEYLRDNFSEDEE